MFHKITDNLDLSDDSASGNGIAAKSYAAGATNSAGVDTTKYVGGLAYTISVGTVGGGGTVDLKVQDSADNVTFADLATPVAIVQITAAGYKTLDVRDRQCRQYIRVVQTVAVAACVCCVNFIGQKKSI